MTIPSVDRQSRCLFVIQNFKQGHGGGPESIRLAAHALKDISVTCDTWDGYHHTKEIGDLAMLPEKFPDDSPAVSLDSDGYDWIVAVGPWQPPQVLWRILKSRAARKKFFYLPRGGLCQAEFVRRRDIKKVPYLWLVEIFWLLIAKNILFSSSKELDYSVAPVGFFRGKAKIAPDFFLPSWSTSQINAVSRPLRVATMGELHPRKGIKELVEAFLKWVDASGLRNSDIELIIAGGPRPGYEWYVDEVQEALQRSPNRGLVSFVGAVEHSARQEFYETTNIFVVASHFESFGLTVLEALSSRCHVVTSPDLGVLEHLEETHNVSIAKTGTSPDLRAALLTAWGKCQASASHPTDDQDFSETIGANNQKALAVWAQMFDIEQTTEI